MKTSLVTPTTGDIEALGNATTLNLTSQHTAAPHTLKPDPLPPNPKVAASKLPPPPPVRGRKRSLPPPPMTAAPRATTSPVNTVEAHSALPESLVEELMKFDMAGAEDEDLALEFSEDAFETTGSRLVKRIGGWFAKKKANSVAEVKATKLAGKPKRPDLPPSPGPGKRSA